MGQSVHLYLLGTLRGSPPRSCRIRYTIVNNRHKQAIMEPVAGITNSSVLPPLVSPVLSLVFEDTPCHRASSGHTQLTMLSEELVRDSKYKKRNIFNTGCPPVAYCSQIGKKKYILVTAFEDIGPKVLFLNNYFSSFGQITYFSKPPLHNEGDNSSSTVVLMRTKS